MDFRRDMNGLRAYAVLAVLLFHFGVPGFGGGFSGVDVFFVLSGYLMTGIIAGGLYAGRFSLTDFYLSRARRILPALAVLCVVLLAAGWFWLSPADYELLGKHAAASINFTSNFTYKDEEGYFDVPSQTKWLLHSWSLSLEWQFYLLYPLLLVAAVKLFDPNKRTLIWTNAGLGALSLLAAWTLSKLAPVDAFYLLHTRAWEMCAGGLVFLCAAQRKPNPWLEISGLLAVLASCLIFDASMPWPGFAALLPVGGAVLVLLANRQSSWLTNNRPAQILGRWSYSVYLWHWPLVVVLSYCNLRGDARWVAAAMLGSLLLGAASYYVIEQPVRRSAWLRRRAIAIPTALGMMIALTVLGTFIYKHHGLPSRVPPEVLRIDAEAEKRYPMPKSCQKFSHDTIAPCHIDAEQSVRWVVMGDSHATSILGAVSDALPGGIHFYTRQCATLQDTELLSKGILNNCTQYIRTVTAQIDALPPDVTLIIINRYAANLVGPNEASGQRYGFHYTDIGEEQETQDPSVLYHQRLVKTLCHFAKKRKVIAVRPIPELGVDVPRLLARGLMTGRPLQDISVTRAEYDARNKVPLEALEQASRQCGVQLIDPTEVLCDAGQCYGAKQGRTYYFDDDHLSESGNDILVPLFRPLAR